ncbi:potassium efflux system KefA protein / Small-conductance mechanosensitive channel [Klebsiella pneumoniae subsp. ozaenae]|uniref:Potassium efflux system KefA protein / Small-conductance mechanosensitive channel n=1 Tax=Klebsiella pneumoniae subsp. ozaenae TaxID=574 RepID=A0A377Z4L5_KLEPO|nr:potassium efflux system KefA protein / Small-conductance mechanosensitive channel [Klebsiella pneumoniae subsp. ozaenae]
MFNASQQLQQIRNRLNGTSVGDETLRPTQQVLLQAQQALLNAQIEQQRKSLRRQHYPAGYPTEAAVTMSPPGATGWSISYSCCRRP